MNDPLVDLRDAIDYVRYLGGQGHNQDALAVALQLVEPATQLFSPGHPDLAEIHAIVGILCRRTRRYDLAAQHQHRALDIRRQYFGEAHTAVASTLNNLGVLYQVMGQHPEAAKYHRRALAIRSAILQPDDPDIAFTKSNLATVLVSQELYGEAEQLLLEAAATFDGSTAGPDWRFVEALANLGGLYGVTGRHDLALAPLGRALALARQFLPPGHYQLLDRQAAVGQCLSRLGRYAEARTELAAAASGYRQQFGDGDERTTGVLQDLADAHHRLGALADAEAIARRLVDGTRPETANHCELLNRLASIHREMGRPDDACAEFEAALRICEEHLDPDGVLAGTILCNLASLHREERRYGLAAAMFERAITLLRQSENEILPIALNSYAVLAQQTGDHTKAEQLLQECATLYEHKAYAHRDVNLARLRGNLGELHHTLGHYEEAEPLLRAALDGARGLFGPAHPNTVIALVNLARLLANTGRPEAALPLFTEAAAADDRTLDEVFSASTAEQRAEFVERALRNSCALLSLAIVHMPGSPTAARVTFGVVLRRKALLAEAILAQHAAATAGHAAVLDDLARVSRRLSSLLLDETDDPKALAELTAEQARLEERLARETDGGALQSRLGAATGAAVAHALAPDRTLIEYVWFPVRDFSVPPGTEGDWGPECYAAFVVSGATLSVHLVDLGPAEPIDELIDGFREAVARGREGVYGVERGTDADDAHDIGIRLRAKIFDPLTAFIAPTTAGPSHLVVAPDGQLSKVPLAILPTGPRTHLLDDYVISYVTTGRRLVAATPPVSGGPALVVADPDFEHASATPSDDHDVEVFAPLPNSRLEGQRIAALLGVDPVLGRDATSTRVLAARSPCILHIATHAYFLPDETEHRSARSGPLFYAPTLLSDESVDSNWLVLGRVHEERFAASGVRRRGPLGGLAARPALSRSGIALAGANTWLRRGQRATEAGVGLLTAEDVAGMDLTGTELVVLSACETGLGSLSRSDGILGLRWACAIAGARSLVMSLWKVPDEETLPFMETLYERILDGEPRASALRTAALALRSRHPDPYFWGAFILEGDAGPLQQVSTGATSVPSWRS